MTDTVMPLRLSLLQMLFGRRGVGREDRGGGSGSDGCIPTTNLGCARVYLRDRTFSKLVTSVLLVAG